MITGIYKKGDLIQSIKYINHFEEISNIVLQGFEKEPNNPKLEIISKGLTEIAFYVNYLERSLANKEIENQSTINKLYQTQKELEELWSVSPEEKLKNFENDSFS